MLGEPSKPSGLNWLQGDGLQLRDFATTARRKCSPYTVLSEKLSQEVLLIAQHIHYRPQLLGFSSCPAACPPWTHSLYSSATAFDTSNIPWNRHLTAGVGEPSKPSGLNWFWPSIIRNSCRRAFYLHSTSPSGVFTIQPCCDTIHHFP